MPESEPRRQWLGWSLTAAWLCSVVAVIALRRSDLCTLKLNELADLAAGAIAPLALLWLVLGYFQQGRELRLNSDALQLQAKELAHQVEETRQLAQAAARQAALLEAEHTRTVEAARPRLQVVDWGSGAGEVYLHLVNHGGRGERVDARATPPAGAACDRMDFLEPNKKFSIRVLSSEWPATVTLSYHDPTGFLYRYVLQVRSNGECEVVSTEAPVNLVVG